MSQDSSFCKNCGKEVFESYCSSCGQRVIHFDWVYLIGRLTDALEFKKGFLYNLKAMTLSPGKAISDYMNGRTKPFLNPMAYALIAITLVFLTGERFNEKFIIGSTREEVPYFIHILIFTFPIMYGFGSFLAYQKSKFNFVQHFILSLFINSQFTILFVLPYLFISMPWWVLLFMFLLYTIWIYHQIFEEHLALTITNQITILIQASFFEAIVLVLLYVILAK